MNPQSKHTAVEFLFYSLYHEDTINSHILRIFEEAILIEKKQIEEAFEYIDFNLDNGEAYYEKEFNVLFQKIKEYKNGK